MIADVAVSEKSFGPKSLYQNVKFSIGDGEKIGVVGRNGVGKSTLFGILAGTDHDFSGEVVFRRGSTVIASRQEHHGFEDMMVLDYILHDLPEYSHLHRIIATYPESMGDDVRKIEHYTDALERFSRLGYYEVEQAIIGELEHFQISAAKAARPLGELSGGQKRLVEVVKIMHAQAHLALIDEPTNHMDYVAKEQFIDWMKRAQTAMLIITHDRDVLREVDRIVEIKDGSSHIYDGNYNAYLSQNAHRTTTSLHDYETVQKQIVNQKAKLAQFRRLKERARDPDTIKQFKRRETEAARVLAELEAIEKPTFWIDRESVQSLNHKVESNYQRHKSKNIRLHGLSSDESRGSRRLVEAQGLSLGYDDDVLFDPIHFTLHEGQRMELRGRNGAGKTTLIKTLLSVAVSETPVARIVSGQCYVAPQLRIGVYEQEVDGRYLPLTLREAITRQYIDRGLPVSDQRVMQLMSDYLFDPATDGSVPVGLLSGGQKARLQLMGMLAGNPQLIVLDEPTNHLDLPSIEELELALGRYGGAVLYVSHDSYFQQNVGGEVVVVG